MVKYCTCKCVVMQYFQDDCFVLQAQKAILDQELMLMTHSGEDTAELKKKVDELKQEVRCTIKIVKIYIH